MRVHRPGCIFCAALMLIGIPAFAQGDAPRKAASLIKAERPLEAEAVLRTIGPQQPDFVAARTAIGVLLLRRAAVADAEAAFREVLQRAPDSLAASFGLGTSLLRKGAAHCNLAMEYWRLRRYDRALEQAQLAEQAGIPQARAAARALSAYLSSRIAP